MLLSVCQGREEAKSSLREVLSLAGRQGGLLIAQVSYHVGDLSSLFLVKSHAFLQEQPVMVEYGACLVIPD